MHYVRSFKFRVDGDFLNQDVTHIWSLSTYYWNKVISNCQVYSSYLGQASSTSRDVPIEKIREFKTQDLRLPVYRSLEGTSLVTTNEEFKPSHGKPF